MCIVNKWVDPAYLKSIILKRIGLKGTAKVSGRYVPLAYWVFRKPLALARQLLGL
jgi:hypothetical protein